MALFHLSVTQTKRSAGQSAIASAAYRAGERLYSEYYGEYSDYTRKGGVICSDILLPSHAPPEYADRQTLWNAVEKAERGKNAQLAYSFDIALQNEFSLEENIALARQFLLENFVSRGMVVDFAVHQPDREDGGIPNPHFHVLCPIRPIEQNGKWGLKQRRVYELDEDGNRIRDADGKFVFNAVPTTDWGSPETLEYWRQTWAELCNAKFAEKGIDVRIDHRSYERQGVDLLPTIHEGATVRAMEKKGIRTEKGEFNRWIRATNAVIMGSKTGLEAIEKTVIDRAVQMIYQPYFADPRPENMPVLGDLLDALMAQGIPEAERVAQALDLYVNGSLNFFNHRTTVDIRNRLVCFDIKGLGKNLKKPGMLIVQDAVWNTVTVNRSIGRATWYFVDEFHLLLKEEQTAAYSAEIWKRFRKWGGVPTGATQNPKDLLSSPEIENILENSDFIYLLNLSAGDRKLMTERLNISAEQLAYVTNADPGSGLLFFQNVILPFRDEFPKDTELYKLLTTKPSEVAHDGESR